MPASNWLAFFMLTMKNPYVIFVLTCATLFSFFYFYEVDLFQAEINSNNSKIIKEIPLRNFFQKQPVPTNYSVKPTLQGWLLLLAIFVGLPVMIAYRITLKRYPRRAEK
jgi:hypothetical protein